MKISSIIALAICILVPLVTGIASGIATSKTDGWYDRLLKPAFNQPRYLFGIVWPILYILMGISLYLVCESPSGPQRSAALLIFAIQLLLNFSWSFIFSGIIL